MMGNDCTYIQKLSISGLRSGSSSGSDPLIRVGDTRGGLVARDAYYYYFTFFSRCFSATSLTQNVRRVVPKAVVLVSILSHHGLISHLGEKQVGIS